MRAPTFTPGIRVDGVWKRFKRGHMHDSLRDLIPAIAQRLTGRGRNEATLSEKEFWALSDVSFAVEPGDAVGIIGHNGAGKSTLLKLIAGIYPPSRGTRRVEGKICSLFDIALGFEWDATGWENIRYRGYLQGEKPWTLEPKVEGIAEFSELGDFLNIPVRYYSAGMLVRLAFAIATSVEPEILLIDEVLAVGDLAFQLKARQRMKDMMANARIMVMVSHEIGGLHTMCSKAVWMDHGNVRMLGEVHEVVAAYQRSVQGAPAPVAPVKVHEPTEDEFVEAA